MEPKKLFQSILKIDVTYGKYALPSGRSRRGQDTHAISELSLPISKSLFILETKPKYRIGYNTHLGSESFSLDFAFLCSQQKISKYDFWI